jgi:hypothetical protein
VAPLSVPKRDPLAQGLMPAFFFDQ